MGSRSCNNYTLDTPLSTLSAETPQEPQSSEMAEKYKMANNHNNIKDNDNNNDNIKSNDSTQFQFNNFNMINGPNGNSLTANITQNLFIHHTATKSPTNPMNGTYGKNKRNGMNRIPLRSNNSNSSSYITPLPLSPTESLSYSQHFGIAADQQLPTKRNDDEIINKNKRPSMSESKKKRNEYLNLVKPRKHKIRIKMMNLFQN